MLRGLFRVLVILLLLVAIRYVFALLSKGLAQAFRTGPPQAGPSAPRGELKKDPVCGTFVPVSSSVKESVNGELIYFCSTTCRDKFKTA